MNFHNHRPKFSPLAHPDAVVSDRNVRFTVLTSRLIRLEYSPAGIFEDHPSQVFWYRNQPVPVFKTFRGSRSISIDTGDLFLEYHPSDHTFDSTSLQITVNSTKNIWQPEDFDWQNLKGTGRTLDEADGEIHLEQGLVSKSGWAVVNDSNSLVFNDQGWLEPRAESEYGQNVDLYFFGYGHDYLACLQDYLKISGSVPLVPRWALGNWWSRYWEYSQDELTDLMKEFKIRRVPLSVCIIDMDWHITKTGNKSTGWTGYTWNKSLFPDPAGFLKWLGDEMGLRKAMNLHPAEGVWPHEESYPQMALAMGSNPSGNNPIHFDISNPDFASNYFNILHHPYEEMGVDFWWMDWQQGARIKNSTTKLAAHLDPLWWLNHLHFFDLGRDPQKRSFIFSRWGGLGNHRYPIGFSGDTVVSWKSLNFQPYFTATAANVGFGWWSHDIGGHMGGIEDPELYLRWVQYGALSPIFRLHSTKNQFQNRAPWSFGQDIFQIARQAMQFRHALIPYIYSMAYRFNQTGIPLCAPMYYQHPEDESAYECPNQYFFGDQLIAAPFTSPRDPETGLSRVKIWLPGGLWFDFFSGEMYSGNRWGAIYGGLDNIPLLARAGAIIPVAPQPNWGGINNPETLLIHVFPGSSGRFELYEDDGVSSAYQNGDYSLLNLEMDWLGDHLSLEIPQVKGTTGHLPSPRILKIIFHAINQSSSLLTSIDGEIVGIPWAWDEHSHSIVLADISLTPTQHLSIKVSSPNGSLLNIPDTRKDKIIKYLHNFKLDSWVKNGIAQKLPLLLDNPSLLETANRYLSISQFEALRTLLEPNAQTSLNTAPIP